MSRSFQQCISIFSDEKYLAHLRKIRRGIERETMRTNTDGYPSSHSHPAALGSALMHASVTTDFSEALLELITEPLDSAQTLMSELEALHCCVARALEDNEYLWNASIPGRLKNEDSIAIAEYGSSNSGLMKTVYRRGLSQRYGRYMQAIAGIHYNFSLPDSFWDDYARAENTSVSQDFINNNYLNLIRGCRSDAWLLTYLFGASPVLSADFALEKPHPLMNLMATGDYVVPYATSLRLSEVGYRSLEQEAIYVSANNLGDYIQSLVQAITKPHPPYQKIGMVQGSEYCQLGEGLLQIENEYYSVARPKCRAINGFSPLEALHRYGIEYVELRCLDINPELPLGIDLDTVYFLDAFLLRCLFNQTPFTTDNDDRQSHMRLVQTVECGRDPNLKLNYATTQAPLQEWGEKIIKECMLSAEILDRAFGHDGHSNACRLQMEKLHHIDKTPSGRLLANMDSSASYYDYIAKLSREYSNALKRQDLDKTVLAEFNQACERSMQEQRALEKKQHNQSFADHRQSYYSGYLLLKL